MIQVGIQHRATIEDIGKAGHVAKAGCVSGGDLQVCAAEERILHGCPLDITPLFHFHKFQAVAAVAEKQAGEIAHDLHPVSAGKDKINGGLPRDIQD